MEVVEVQRGSSLFEDVLALHRKHRSTLGLLPYAAFNDYADARTILGVVTEDELAGYALYDLPGDFIALRQLCTDERHRGTGVARALVEELVRRHPERRGIRVRCRRDYPAARMWPHLDFEPIDDVPGRSAQGHLLTVWWRDFGHPHLFSDPAPTKTKVAIDTDVFLDLFEARRGGEESRHLLDDWVADQIELCATKELANELNRQPDSDARRKRLRDAQFFRTADSPAAPWRATEEQLKEAAGIASPDEHDLSDIRHVARAAAAGIPIFATRDQNLIRRIRPHALSILDIRVMTPTEIVREVHESRVGKYAPVELEGTSMTSRTIRSDEVDSVVSLFRADDRGERTSQLRQTLLPLLSDPTTWSADLVHDTSGEPLVVVVYRLSSDSIDVPVLRARGRTAPTLARHAAHRLRRLAAAQDIRQVRVTDAVTSRVVEHALAQESFVRTPDEWASVAIRAAMPSGDLAGTLASLTPSPTDELGLGVAAAQLRAGPVNAIVAAELEKRFWPMKVTDADIPTFLVPIAARFAERLFDVKLSEQTLFWRPDNLGVACEHVYYRAAVGTAPRAPARLHGTCRTTVDERARRRYEHVPGLRKWSSHTRTRCTDGSTIWGPGTSPKFVPLRNEAIRWRCGSQIRSLSLNTLSCRGFETLR